MLLKREHAVKRIDEQGLILKWLGFSENSIQGAIVIGWDEL